jgi:secernin
MCDTLVSITDDGVLFAKNSDRDPDEAQLVEWHAAADHDPGATVDCTWTAIPQVARTHAIVLSRPWWMWGAEMGANEHGVVIGNEAVFTHRSQGDAGLLGMDLLRLALERATTADAAVSTLVDLLERHGQGGPCSQARPDLRYHNSFLVADARGAIVLETADRHWATEVVTGPGRAISNGLTIPAFHRAHADLAEEQRTRCGLRRARTEASASGATTPRDLFAALRDHGAGAPPIDGTAHTAPPWDPSSGSLDGPCAHAGGDPTSIQTTASWVADLRTDPIHWATGTAAPCTSTFKPIRVHEPTDLGTDPGADVDPATTWWAHERLHRLALRDLGPAIARFAMERDAVEARWLADPPATADAFADSRRLEERWLADLVALDLPDRRPPWLRQAWSGLRAVAPSAAAAG